MRRAFICPSKYVQGENELLNLGYFVRQYGTSALLVATKSSVKRVREALDLFTRQVQAGELAASTAARQLLERFD